MRPIRHGYFQLSALLSGLSASVVGGFNISPSGTAAGPYAICLSCQSRGYDGVKANALHKEGEVDPPGVCRARSAGERLSTV